MTSAELSGSLTAFDRLIGTSPAPVDIRPGGDAAAVPATGESSL